MKKLDKYLTRLDDFTLKVNNSYGIDALLIANDQVGIESDGIEQLYNVMSINDSLDQLKNYDNFFGDSKPAINKIVLTPDFHKGGNIPVGTVIDTTGFMIPSAVGNDICCGMRLLSLDISYDEIVPYIGKLESNLRDIFFGGKRNIPMSSKQRQAMITDGLCGIHRTSSENSNNGLWKFYDRAIEENNINNVHFSGSFNVDGNSFDFSDYIKSSGNDDSRDSQIGSIGGGNHFVEIQSVDTIFNGNSAYEMGLKKNNLTIMIHSGSVGLGHMIGGFFTEEAKRIYPKNVKYPEHNFFVLPIDGKNSNVALRYMNAMSMAANFAFANRLFLGLMAVRAISETLNKDVGHKLIYDAPHNLIWNDNDSFLHRKGACPALGAEQLLNTKYKYYWSGSPVIIPGSMGDASFVMNGSGNNSLLMSACHGAGRSLTRGEAQHHDNSIYHDMMNKLHVVTAIDPNNPAIKCRSDILNKFHQKMKEEAPFAYKPINSIIDSVEGAKVATKTARMWPVVTVKG